MAARDIDKKRLPVIGITTGDPAGIGPEISLKALADGQFAGICEPRFIGDMRHLTRVANDLKIPVELISNADERKAPGEIFVYDMSNVGGDVAVGVESAAGGKASAEYIETAVELWRTGNIDAIATAPISKAAISAAGYDFPGHTEFLAALTESPKIAMSFFADDLRVVLLSTHVSLLDAIARVKKDGLVELIKFTNARLAEMLGRDVSIAVAGLNPHASEGGMFGTEEAAEIIPAVEQCRGEGINVSGPFSPDTIFLRGAKGEFDAVIACYHDQATIAVKSLAFGNSVNVTLGLPLIRTSVDHGTAFDIAGKGIAESSSMAAAIRLAAELSAVKIRNS
jgi:4-hydroxythreonine-4-phosphate dehydrogenase